ncbi:YadA-like family protein [Stenotrophomonas pigmentata]|uniref:YadA-like family protein n=1 Tax=Stenotrophomonas pigmentata TaxID=3055080 RepID=UPI0026ED92BB|nr:YadA-like family protein [Stenotrophomonas sp. 610A2]
MNIINRSSLLFLAIAGLLITGQASASIIQLGTDAIAYTNGDIAIGDGTRAQGGMAQGQNANAFGSGCYAMALGRNANASCSGSALGGSTAIGFAATSGYGAIAVGDQANARVSSVALGNRTIANDSATAVGTGAVAGTFASTAIGAGAEAGGAGGWVAINGRALGLNSIAIGGVATHSNSIALGTRSTTNRDNQLSVGRPGEERVISNVAAGSQSNDAVIYQQVVPAITGIVSGLGGGATYNPATGVMTASSYVLSMGTYNNVGDALVALDNKPPGSGSESPYFKANGGADTTPATATSQQSTAGGVGSNADGEAATTYGYRSSATQEGTTVGAFTTATARCDAFGYAAECDENDTTSFGREGDESRLVRVAAGRDATDAVNVGQVAPYAAALGGGSNFNHGVFTPPNYVFSTGATFNNVGDALLYLEGLGGGSGPSGPQGPAGQTGADGRSAYQVAVDNGFVGTQAEWLESLQGADGRDGEDGNAGSGSDVAAGDNIEVETNEDGTQTVSLADNIQLSDEGSLTVGGTTVNANGVSIEGGPSMTRDGIDAGGQRITSVANGRIERGSTDAVNGGQIYDLQNNWNDRWTETNSRIDQLSDDVQALGAQSAAMSMMTGAGTYLPVGKVAVSAGVGFYGNKAAFAVGLKARASERSSWSIGISISPDGKPMGGVGYSYTFGQ